MMIRALFLSFLLLKVLGQEPCKIDICFMLDRSGSIGGDFGLIKDFVKNIVQGVGISPDGGQAGMVIFSTSAATEWDLDDNPNLGQQISAINGISEATGGTTDIIGALNLCEAMLEGPSVRSGVPNVAILLSDGQQTGGSGGIPAAADALKGVTGGVTVITIGIGSGVNEADMREIASGDGDAAEYIPIDSADDFDQIVDPLLQMACPQPECGNEAVEDGEECEPPNTSSCDANCQFRCGNDFIDTAWGEECEPPNTQTCDADCQNLVFCGNDIVDGNEDCDPPNTQTCDGNCQFRCGNDVIDVDWGEECDPPNGQTCDANCQNLAFCGNDIVDGNDECEPPNTQSCDGNCKDRCGNDVIDVDWGEECEPPNTQKCDGNCKERCGNDVIDADWGEDCEPPNTQTCDGNCQNRCGNDVIDVDWGEECDPPSVGNCDENCKFKCGNGRIDAGEECDPPRSLTVSGQTCDGFCQITPVCGNGVIEEGEECELPNTLICDADCQLKTCGNGVLDDDEECDYVIHEFCDIDCELECVPENDLCNGHKCDCCHFDTEVDPEEELTCRRDEEGANRCLQCLTEHSSESCDDNEDCCNEEGLTCGVNNKCCLTRHTQCITDEECCDGMVCNTHSNTCQPCGNPFNKVTCATSANDCCLGDPEKPLICNSASSTCQLCGNPDTNDIDCTTDYDCCQDLKCRKEYSNGERSYKCRREPLTCASRGEELGLDCSCRHDCRAKNCNAGQSVGFGGGKFCGTGVCCCGDCSGSTHSSSSSNKRNRKGKNKHY